MKINQELKSLIPDLTNEEYTTLEKSILEEGIRDPLITWEGYIVDGHNRYAIAEKHGLEFQTIAKHFDTIEDVKLWMIDNQKGRRNLSKADWLDLGFKRAELLKPKAEENRAEFHGNQYTGAVFQKSEKVQPINTTAEAAKYAGVSTDTASKYKKVIESKNEDIKAKVKTGDYSINQAYIEMKRSEKKEDRIKKHEELKKKEFFEPTGKYSVIYADPPWPVGSIVMDKWESPIDDKYPTMSIEQIANMKIQEISADSCSLFLWTTHSFLPDAFYIMEKWGFKYFCIITWDKGGGWTQNGFHKRTELLLYGYKGKMNVIDTGKAIPTIIKEAKGKHSKKPDSIRDMIAEKTPGPRIELFARESFEGWKSWGNEI